jgi:hypothetical protein
MYMPGRVKKVIKNQEALTIISERKEFSLLM